jgi:hypothetical protein
MAKCRGTGHESAEAIVGARKQARQAGKDLPRRRAEHREGKNLYELSWHDESVWRSAHGARRGIVRPE